MSPGFKYSFRAHMGNCLANLSYVTNAVPNPSYLETECVFKYFLRYKIYVLR